MKFLLDHDVPIDLARVLRQGGHEVAVLADVLPTTTTDSDLLRYAHQQGDILVSCNRDDFPALTHEF